MKALAIFLLMLLPLSATAGQLSSDFRGKVVDAQGHAIAAANVVVIHEETGRITRHVSNSKGRWHAIGKRSDGTYRVLCYAPGADTPSVRFRGRVALGQTHVRNCVIDMRTASHDELTFVGKVLGTLTMVGPQMACQGECILVRRPAATVGTNIGTLTMVGPQLTATVGYLGNYDPHSDCHRDQKSPEWLNSWQWRQQAGNRYVL